MRRSLQRSAVVLVPTPDFPYLPDVREELKQLLHAHNPRPDVKTRSSVVPGVYIRAMLEGQLNDIHTSAARCHIQ